MPESTIDLDAYFNRIGYAGSRAPTLETLSQIHGRHAQTIPFENLDVLLDRGIRLDLPSIQKKLIFDRRGGYCFEHNGLLLAVLRSLGFSAIPLIARVRWQVSGDLVTPQSHMVLRVEIDGRPWLADAGFGGVGLTAPIALDTTEIQGHPPEPRRLVAQGGALLQQVQLTGTWHDVYLFRLDAVPSIDFEVANWYTSAHPNSRFRKNLIVARVDGDRRLSIQNREFTIREPDGPARKRQIETPDELLAVLRDYFGLVFPAGTRFGPVGAPWPS